ncbi:hypothetical protein [Aphanothece sacrum]|uniref:1-alkyl-2-acetylglycerophosphocholine esterase n=1 Tax=Aphanothece sacrum FPU1 TaxID=1920663 RepID=A0A401IKD3_APHSA|nr:hypothetical protein [Aphanothece sacrum]GBF81719.1 1-alkyl-2-acetylglycerophosphocholine esterase [Aphanothece sacrum FPU1]GBF85077.1 1-alkyl-2-acetylglycerophosphocholine esterase [Aphanothece sacrum FPU3]
MNKLNRKLLTIIASGWLCFIITAILISQVFASPNYVLLIDRSYCPPQQWQTLLQTYTDLYEKHQQKQVTIEKVILFSDLGEETLQTLPTPKEFNTISTYGRFNPTRKTELTKAYRNGKILTCQ